ncbi:extracellular solute-binding protein [Oecophyllibacter saccharovorans]|uniref:Extracellular solute-binding protein n=1 Tax=Oecophyllibacter saccharovorans TaxID=2558360 RepID=A0A506ULJ0_9PROT|nr:extracellular solute-binding protein [Oecophyllibacter saccharovorans]TPW34227.1 extracellular solute-binding protein [Oecophyllibacter saccharovorans]
MDTQVKSRSSCRSPLFSVLQAARQLAPVMGLCTAFLGLGNNGSLINAAWAAPQGPVTLAVPEGLLPPGEGTVTFPESRLRRKWRNSELLTLPPLTGQPQSQPQTVRLESWNTLEPTLESTTTHFPPRWQAVLTNTLQAQLGCVHSWLQPLDSKGNCGLAAGVLPVTLVWDSGRLHHAPDWSALWDVVRLPGQRSLPATARGTLEIALLADGVTPGNVYRLLATPAGVDRAFWRLDQLRPYIVWWQTPLEARRFLERREVLMGLAPTALLPAGQKAFVTNPDHVLYSPQVWTLPATLDTLQTNRVTTLLHERTPGLPPLPTSRPSTSLLLDDTFWATHGQALEERFQTWRAQKVAH